jgi:hypothetical protein
MMSKSVAGGIAAIVLWSTIASTALAQDLKDTLNDIDVGARWSYDDWDSVKAAAAKSKKPILALFR